MVGGSDLSQQMIANQALSQTELAAQGRSDIVPDSAAADQTHAHEGAPVVSSGLRG